MVIRKTQGFTVVELMVVVAMVAVLATIAAPSFTTMIKGTRIKGNASDLHMSLVKARSEAVKRNAQVMVKPLSGSDWESGWRVMLVDAPFTEFARTPEPAGISISSNPANPDDVTYLASGRVLGNNPPLFTFDADPPFKTASSRNDRCRTIRVGTSGIPTVSRVDCPEPP